MKISHYKVQPLVVVFFILFLKNPLFSQKCGFEPDEAFTRCLQNNVESIRRNGQVDTRGSIVNLGLRICVIHKLNVSGESQATIQSQLDRVNNAFLSVGVHFDICSFADIPNNDLADFETFSQSDVDLINMNCNDPRLINIYIVDKICGTVCVEGNTEIASNEIFLRRGNLFSPNSPVFIHEMGHLFGLMHTFGNSQCDPTKDPNGSDDAAKGDMIPDTPADPGLFCNGNSPDPIGCTPSTCIPCNCSYVDNTCNYIGRGTYSRFHPQVNNYMAYSRASCYGIFTRGQIDVMKANIPRLQNLACQTNTCPDNYEPNNTRETANTYLGTFGATSVSKPTQGKISYNGDLDFFKVRFTQAGTFKVEIASPPKNYNIYLYKGTIPVSESRNAGTQAEAFTSTITTADLNVDFYILIQGAGSSDFDCANPYNLLVTWQPQTSGGGSCIDQYELGKIAFPDTLGAISYTKTITANFENDYDGDGYTININHAGEIEVDLCGLDNSFNACLEFGYGGGPGVPRSCADGVDCQKVVYNFLRNYIYREKIFLYPKIVTNCSKQYRLTVKWTPKDPIGSGEGNAYCSYVRDYKLEPNDIPAQAHFEQGFILNDSLGSNGLHQSGRIHGYLTSPTDVDYHKIQVDKKGIIGFSFCQPDNLNAILELVNSNGQVIYSTKDCVHTADPVYLETGEYYIRVRSLNGTYICDDDYYFEFAYKPTETSGGGGSNNNWTCSEAIDLNVVGTCSAYGICDLNSSNIGKPNIHSTYGCTNFNMNGGEVLYKIFWEGGIGSTSCTTPDFSISLTDFTGNIDDYFIFLYKCGSNLNQCIAPHNIERLDFGFFRRVRFEWNDLPPGIYYFFVDTKNGVSSNYKVMAGRSIVYCISSSDRDAIISGLSYQDFICGIGNQQYATKIKIKFPAPITITSTYPVQNLGDNTFLIQNIPNGVGAPITISKDNVRIDTVLFAHNCQCDQIAMPANPQNATLCNGSTAQISVTFPNTEGYEVRWYDTAVGGTILGRGTSFQTNKVGIYYAEAVQIATGCASSRVLVVVTSPNIPVAVVQKAIVCKGGSDGALTATPLSNFAARYTYKWSTGQTTASITNLNMGTYSVTVTDSSNCSIVLTERLADPQIFARITARDINCTASNAQTLDAFAYSAGRNLQYQWSRGDTTATLQNTNFGSYRLTVTDDKGCKVNDSIEVEDKSFYSIAYIENPTCKGRSDGKVTLSVLNGANPYTFAWNNGKTTPSVDSLIAGRYVVAIQDAKGCRRTDTIDVSEPDSLKLYVNKSNPTCVDSTNGKIAVYVDGGNGLYAYQWNTQATSYNLTNLSAGTFNVQVKDRLNCMASTTIDMLKPDNIRINPTITPNPCAEQQKGAIALQVNGGKSPYKYVWQRGDTLPRIVGLAAGSYNLTIVDSNKCVVKKAYQINNLPPLESRITAIGTKCSYTQDGILKIDTLMGFPPYQIGIDAQSNSANRSFPNLTAGQHKLIILDTYGCKWDKPFEIKQAPELLLVAATSNSDSILKLGETTDLTVSSTNYTLQTVQWQPPTALSCSTCPTTAAMPFSTTKYTVKVKTTEGCEGTTEKQIKVSTEKPVFAPTAFSPNSDGSNDYFTLFGPIGAKQVKVLKIFNRWGGLVFSRETFALNDQTLGWDGTYRGQSVEQGVYIYYAEVEFVNGQIVQVKGDVSVVK